MRITLKISPDEESSRQFWLDSGQAIVVGRTESAEFAVPGDVQMSSMHFSVTWVEGEFKIRDLNSTNGTKVNGDPVREVTLKHGDEVVAGNTRFRVTLERDRPNESPDVVQLLRATVAASEGDEEEKYESLRQMDSIDVTPETSSKNPLDLPRPEATPSGPTLTDSESPPLTARYARHPGEPETDEVVMTEFLAIDNATPFVVAPMPWDNGKGKCRLTVVIKATFTFEHGVAIADEQLPILFGDRHDDDDPFAPVMFESDMVPFKPRADIVLVGNAHAPGRRPVPQLDVKLQVGQIKKTIRVFGDRRWIFPSRLALIPQVTRPEPFVSMALTYRRAFGGIDEAAARYCKENLAGVGFAGDLGPKSLDHKPLPNLEDPNDLIHSWDTRPKPVGFGFYGRGWMPRLKYAGTYDEKYQNERAPLPPLDFSYELYNGAHPDLQVEGFLRGNEDIQLENLTPHGRVTFQLPNIRPTVALTRCRNGVEENESPVQAKLDTLVLIPDERIFYLVYRVVFALESLDDIDVTRVLVAT